MIVRHEEIPGFMPKMTMEFTVRDRNELRGLKVDETITFRLKANNVESWIEGIQQAGRVDLPSLSFSFSHVTRCQTFVRARANTWRVKCSELNSPTQPWIIHKICPLKSTVMSSFPGGMKVSVILPPGQRIHKPVGFEGLANTTTLESWDQ